MSKLKDAVKDLKKQDIYTLMLFYLFKLQGNPKYSTLSELIYLLGEDDFLKLCEYFGGMTIQIPQVEELEVLVDALLLYQYIKVEGRTESEAYKMIHSHPSIKTKSKKMYNSLESLMDNYEIKI